MGTSTVNEKEIFDKQETPQDTPPNRFVDLAGYIKWFMDEEGKRTFNDPSTMGLVLRIQEWEKIVATLSAQSVPSARGHITELPAEFAALAEFYQVDDMPALIRTQAEHIERLQKKLPPLRGPESDPQNYRQG